MPTFCVAPNQQTPSHQLNTQYHPKTMTTLLQKRRKELRTELVQIEKQIYDLETAYLDETKDIGNIFSGWDAYLASEKVKVRKTTHNEDRHFSLSSITSPASRREESKKGAVQSSGVRGRTPKKIKTEDGSKERSNSVEDDEAGEGEALNAAEDNQ